MPEQLRFRRICLIEHSIKGRSAHRVSGRPAHLQAAAPTWFRRKGRIRRNAQKHADGCSKRKQHSFKGLPSAESPATAKTISLRRQQNRFVRRRGFAGEMLCTVGFQKHGVCLRHPGQGLLPAVRSTYPFGSREPTTA